MSVRFDVVSPSIFHPGDIVEAQVSLVTFPAKEGRSVMRLMLRSLALLDGQFAQAENQSAGNTSRSKAQGWVRRAKR